MGSSSTAAVEEQTGQRSKSDSEEAKSKGVDWRVFSCPSVWAVMVAQVACNNQNNTIRQWGPTYFTDILGSTPAMAGSYMATSGVVNFLAGFATVRRTPPFAILSWLEKISTMRQVGPEV